ncbi:MAG: ABC transporter permease subunit [Planctomycetota bacterium]
MPVHDVGYRSWKGLKTPQLSRWGIIASTGIRLAAKSRWVRRILFVAWLPVMYWGAGFFFIEQALEADTNVIREALPEEIQKLPLNADMNAIKNTNRRLLRRQLRNRFAMFPHADDLADALESEDTGVIRNSIWRWLLMVFFRYPQAILILFLVGTVAPGLISRDMRSRAFLLYFSRPIGKLEYIIGKLAIPGSFIIAVTTLPALALYLFAIMMSPSISVLFNTWEIPLRILAATVVLVLPTASIALMLSSLTQESRFANFAWFAIWALGHGAWMAVVVSTAIRVNEPPFHPSVMNDPLVVNWSVLSIYNCLGDVQEWIFGFEKLEDVWQGTLVLSLVTTASLFILYRRVSAPIRV